MDYYNSLFFLSSLSPFFFFFLISFKLYVSTKHCVYSNPLATSVARGSKRKKKRKKKKRQNDQVIGFFPVKWRTLGPISRRMQLDGSIRETRISRFEENSCSIIGSNDSFPFSINRYSEKFQARFLPDTRGNDNEKNDEKFA